MRELIKVKGVGPKTLLKLNALGIYSVDDLLQRLPCDYINLDSVSNLDDAENGVFVLLSLEISNVSKPHKRGRLTVFGAYGVTDSGKKVKLTWYNALYVSKFVKVGVKIRAYGKIKIEKGYELINPVYEVVEDGVESKFKGIKPVYRTKGYIPQATYISMVHDALNDYVAESIIPNDLEGLDLTTAFNKAHNPIQMSDIHLARDRVLLEEAVTTLASFRMVKAEGKRSIFYQGEPNVVQNVVNTLPYRLTDTQKQSVNAIIETFNSPKPMNAMLVGDVGSGKTIVAVLSSYYAVTCGHQCAIMAPTEILATQHYFTFKDILSPLGVKVALVTGSMPTSEKRKILTQIATHEIDVVVGTHAVISNNVQFADLSYVVIDEQHRFGVAQRTKLIDKGNAVDILTLSATPIPRSLRLTMYADIDVMTLEKRHDSDNVQTSVVTPEKRIAMLDYVVGECEKGRQAYIVAPKIYDAEGLEEGYAVDALYKKINARYGKRINIAFLHGKLKAEQKTAILEEFRLNRVQMLISTTVIEVGIDVPNASLMCIFDADRFGLATLHQLRGRVGRDGSKAYCFLYTSRAESEIVRLRTLSQERDGLKIAEKDYELRGAGEWMGESQSGGGNTPSLLLMKRARKIVDQMDFTPYREALLAYAERFELNKISLT